MTKEINKLKLLIQTEVDAAFLYQTMASNAEDIQVKTYYQSMQHIEENHATKFLQQAEAQGLKLALPTPSKRAQWIVRFGKLFGPSIILGVLLDTEKSISNAALQHKKALGIAFDGSEQRHLEILKTLAGLDGAKLNQLEGRHRNVGGNALRAGVLGANDGLVSNLSLVMGVAGATAGGKEVLIAGTAGLLAGAISMALGEWISVKSSQELYERQIEIEQEELTNNPEEEKQELILLYRAKGLDEVQAKALVERVSQNPEFMRDVLVKEELNINPEELKSSANEAAITSFVLFIAGAIIPLAPFFFLQGEAGITTSLVASTIGLFIIGALITLLTGKNLWKSGFRQVFFGLVAAAITYGIGRLLGTTVL